MVHPKMKVLSSFNRPHVEANGKSEERMSVETSKKDYKSITKDMTLAQYI